MSDDSKVTLQPITRMNWETCIALQPDEDQQKFIPSNLFSLAQCHYENCEPFGIYAGEKMVGFLVIGKFSQIPWITRIMIDKNEQMKGYASKALQLAIDQVKKKTGIYEIRTSIARSNALAEHLFTAAGFKRREAIDDKEVMMVLEW